MRFHFYSPEFFLVILLFILNEARPEAEGDPQKTSIVIKQTRTEAQGKPFKPAGLMAQMRLEGSLTGWAKFYQKSEDEPVVVQGMAEGFVINSNSLHGFHIHEFGNTSENCAAAGGHYNPEGVLHGAPEDSVRHVGDLGNIEVLDGKVEFCKVDDVITLYSGVNSIVGRALVIHQGEDDLGQGGDEGSEASGNAGPRLACGVVEYVDDVIPITCP